MGRPHIGGPSTYGGPPFLACYLDVGSGPLRVTAPYGVMRRRLSESVKRASNNHWAGREAKAMENPTKLQVVEIESEVRSIIAELDVALSFLREANETSDEQRQQRLIKYAQIAHQAVLRLQPSLALSGLDETRINIRLLQIRASLKRHGIAVARTLKEMVISQRKRSEKAADLN